MALGGFGGMGGMVSSYLATSERQEAARNYLTFQEGIAMLKQFVSTPGGQKTMLSILPLLLDELNLPPTVKEAVRDSLEKSV